MKAVIHTQNIASLMTSEIEKDKFLFGLVLNLMGAQTNGGLPKEHIAKKLVFPNISNDDCPLSYYKMFYDEAIVTISDYPLFIYAPVAFLETDVFADLPNATTFDADDIEVAVKWKNWKADVNYNQPLHQNETHCIISCQSFGKCLTEIEASTIIDREVSEGIVLMSGYDKAIKIAAEFNIEE
jgi:hypothetical protein